MAYVHRLINEDEQLIGIARLHWIYIMQGLMWFFALALTGWGLNLLIGRGLSAMAGSMNGTFFYTPLSAFSGGIMGFMVIAGACIFSFYVIKVLATSVALTNRRVIHKWGLLFVNVHQIDLEEIRGENIDLGMLGRILGYGEIMLDCRFIGDIRLPAIEQPERFIRAMNDQRAHLQNALNLIMGKSNVVNPVNVVGTLEKDQPDPDGTPAEQRNAKDFQREQEAQMQAQDHPSPGTQPEVNPPSPPQPGPARPEIEQPAPDQIPPPPNRPDPNQPPPVSEGESRSLKDAAKSHIRHWGKELMNDIDPAQFDEDKVQAPRSMADKRREEKQSPGENASSAQAPQADAGESETGDEQAKIAHAIAAATPEIARNVIHELQMQGLLKEGAAEHSHDNQIDNELMDVFDEAALNKDASAHDPDNRLERSVH